MTSRPPVQEAAAAAAAAIPALAGMPPRQRAAQLLAGADAIDERADELIELASAETGIEAGRLRGEVRRSTVQLRLFADEVVSGEHLDVRIDEADEEFALGVRPDLRRMLVPLGPVLNFAASNFPFAFSVAGGDTASALAAGCPVIVKAHPGHPQLSRRTAEVFSAALNAAGAPAGTFQLVEGEREGVELLQHPLIAAAAFTGSVRGGQYLAGLAAARPTPIPFYGELGSLNPVVVTPAALDARRDEIVSGFAASVTGNAGQLCTKPGFLFVPSGSDLGPAVAAAVEAAPEHRLLYPKIAEGYADRRATILGTDGVTVQTEGGVRFDDDQEGWARPTIVSTDLDTLLRESGRLSEEAFGPLSILVEYDDGTRLAELFGTLFEGTLTAGVHVAEGADAPWVAGLVAQMTAHAGRVLFDGWPTGVAVSHAQQHGGPWPSTTTSTTTSVGTAAIQRFLRPVAFQNAPVELLPPALRDDNPWGVVQRRYPAGESRSWGTAAASAD